MQKTYYEKLGLKENASPLEVKKAYRKLILTYHPDRNFGDRKSHVITLELNVIYAVLSDPIKRSSYDVELSHSRSKYSHDSHKTATTQQQGTKYQNTSSESNPTRSHDTNCNHGNSYSGVTWMFIVFVSILLKSISHLETTPTYSRNNYAGNYYWKSDIKTDNNTASLGDSLFGNLQYTNETVDSSNSKSKE